MASLPPRPIQAQPEREERRYDDRERHNTARPMAPVRYNRPDGYVPSPSRGRGSSGDTYVPGRYDSRRDSDYRRGDDRYRGRERDTRDHARSRERDRERDGDRRTRDSRPPPRSRDDNRDRGHRMFERDRHAFRRPYEPRQRGSRSPQRRDHDDSNRESPRSPKRRSPLAVAGPSHSRSPSPSNKRLKVDPQPPTEENASSSIAPNEPLGAPQLEAMRQDQSSEPIIEKPHDSSLEHTSRPEQVPQVPHSMEHVPTITVISELQEVIVSRSSDPPRSPDERAPPSEGIPEKASESHQERPAQAQTQSPIPSIPDTEKDAQGDVKMQDRSHSPQRYPKSRTTIPPSRGTPHSYSVPKSPPRGPRGVKPQTLIAPSLPQYTPTGPRGRRPYQPAAPSEPQQDTSAQRVQETEPEYKIPLVGGKARTWFDPDPEIKRTQQRIYYLAEKHSELSRDLRRAMHELDMSTIDLHAAECRRKYAEQQMDRARNGILAMDASCANNVNNEVPTTMS